MTIFSTVIKEIGENASEFLDSGMLVMFGSEAPADLRPYCFLIELNPLEDIIESGDILIIDETEYKILAVGGHVNKNLRDLGHITIDFKGVPDNSMLGTLYTEEKSIAKILVGTKITIRKA